MRNQYDAHNQHHHLKYTKQEKLTASSNHVIHTIIINQKLEGIMVHSTNTIKQARELIRRLPLKDRVKLVEELERETWYKRMARVIKSVQKQRTKSKLTDKDIHDEIERARTEFHAGHH